MNIKSATQLQDDDGNNYNILLVAEGREWVVPLDLANRHYAEIMRQVEAGTLVVQDAE